jgi:hypothetical protein
VASGFLLPLTRRLVLTEDRAGQRLDLLEWLSRSPAPFPRPMPSCPSSASWPVPSRPLSRQSLMRISPAAWRQALRLRQASEPIWPALGWNVRSHGLGCRFRRSLCRRFCCRFGLWRCGLCRRLPSRLGCRFRRSLSRGFCSDFLDHDFPHRVANCRKFRCATTQHNETAVG